jgi:Tfp pilus assembly protein PilF
MNSFFLEHWLYVPSMAVAWIFGALALKDKTRLHHALFALIVGALALTTYRQNRMWESPLTLFTTILKHNPGVTRVRHNLAMTYSDLGKVDLAQAEYETILKDDPNPYPQTLHNLGLIYLQKNQLEEGEKMLLKAIEISPKFYPSYDYLIQLYKFKGDLPKAQEWEYKKSQL